MGVLLKDVQRRIGDEVKLTPAATDFLVEHGYDQTYGARPLKRAIQRYIEDPLSEKILMAEFSRGDEIVVDVSATEKDKLEFRVLSPASLVDSVTSWLEEARAGYDVPGASPAAPVP